MELNSQQQETIIAQRGKNPVYRALGISEVTKLFLDQLNASINMESSPPTRFRKGMLTFSQCCQYCIHQSPEQYSAFFVLRQLGVDLITSQTID